MRALPLILALALCPATLGAAERQPPETAPTSALPADAASWIGKTVTLRDSNKQVGHVTGVQADGGKITRVVIEMSSGDRTPVVVDATKLSQDGRQLRLALSEQELAALPHEEGTAGSNANIQQRDPRPGLDPTQGQNRDAKRQR